MSSSPNPNSISHSLCLMLALIVVLFGGLSSRGVAQPQGTRSIGSDDFTKNRQASSEAGNKSQGQPSNGVTSRPKPRRTYRLASQPMKTRPAKHTNEIAQLGVTMWRLRLAGSADNGGRALIREKSKGWLPERVEGETFFHEGDFVRISVESPRSGYLYVIDRDLFADGTTGGAMLIYPWPGADNRMAPGKLVDIPAQEDDPSYFTARLTSPNQAGELLTFIVTSTPLDLPISDKPFQISNMQMSRWEKLWGIDSERFEMEGGAGEGWTIEEQQASMRTGSRQLTREDPAPQTIYRVSTSDNKGMMVNVRLRYGK